MSRSQERKSIVFVLPHYGVGGAEKQLANLILHRPDYARSLDIHTITFLPPTSEWVTGEFERAGALNHLIDRSSMSFPAFFYQLVRTMRELRPAVVSTILDSSVGAWGRLAAVLTGVPAIVHSDLMLLEEGTRAHYMLRPFLDRRTRLFLPNAEAIADRVVAAGVPRERVRVVRNGVDLSLFDPDVPRSFREDVGVPPDEVVLGFLGRFAPVKRVDRLLEAVLLVPPERRPDRLLLAGDGPTMPDIERQVAADPWLAAHVQLLGNVTDPAGFLSAVDYLVLCSDTEGLPNVIIEAMAMRKPVVATAVSDVPILIGDTGLVAAPADPADLGRRIGEMQALGAAGRAELGRRARDLVEREYAMDIASGRFWDAHLELAPGLRPAPAAG